MKYFLRCIQLSVLVSFIFFMSMCNGTSGEKNDLKEFPNVLLISLDACRADSLSCYGYQRQTSPFIDQIALSGIRFTNAFVNTFGTATSHTTMLSSLYQESHKVDYYSLEDQIPPQVVMIQEILKAHGFVTLGVTDGGRTFSYFGFNRGFWVYNDHGGGVFLGTKKMTKLIRQYMPTKKPIFAFYHTYEIHSPYAPPPKYKKLFGDFKSGFIPTGKNLLKIKDVKSELSQGDMDFLKAMYDGEIKFTDDILKKFFSELDDIGFFNNYILIITADHGEEFGEHGGVLHGFKLYDELLRVPLIIKGTHIPKGLIDKRMAGAIDIVPTILDYLNIKSYTPIAGKSLLTPPSTNNRKNEMVFSQSGKGLYSVRTPKWKCIEKIIPAKMELYDLSNDPLEKNNIASQNPGFTANLKKHIHDWKEKCYQISEKRNIVAKKTKRNKLTEKQIEQLKTLGYVTDGFKSKKESEQIDGYKNFSKQLQNIKLPQATNNITTGIGEMIVENDFVRIIGWAHIKGKDSLNSHIYIVLKSQDETIIFDSFLQARPDVATAYMNENLEDSGFITTIPKESLKKGKYQVGIYIEKENLKALQFVSKFADII